MIKKFIKKILFFLIITSVCIEAIAIYLIYTKLYLINYPGAVIHHSIIKSKKENKAKILVLGDSVGQQIFPISEFNDTINSLATIRPIGVVGQFLLLKNYLKTGNKIDKVFLIFTPTSFQVNLNQKTTYHYFLKPFNSSEYSSLFSNTVVKQINKIPYHQFCRVPHIFATTWAPNYISSDEVNFTFLSPISIEYLNKIKELAIRYQFKFRILPTPTNMDRKFLVDKIDKNEILINNFENEFKDYFKNIIYLDNTFFKDSIHLKKPKAFTEIYKNKMIR